MANLRVASGDSLQKIAFKSERIFREVLNALTFAPFTSGKNMNDFAVLQQFNMDTAALNTFSHGKGSGVKDRFFLPLAYSGDPVKNGSRDVVTGQEEALTIRTFDHEIDMYEKDVETGSMLSHLRSFVDLNMESEVALSNFMIDHVDTLHFNALNKDSTPTDFIHFNSSNAVTTTTTEPTSGTTGSTLLNPEFLKYVSEVAATGDSVFGNLSSFRIKKVPINGIDSYILLVTPRLATQIAIDPTFAQYARELANAKSDPIFKNAVAHIGDILIVSSEKVADDGTLAKCSLIGANSLLVSLARPEGLAFDIVPGSKNAGRSDWLVGRWFVKVSKPQFANSAGTLKDYGSLGVYFKYA